MAMKAIMMYDTYYQVLLEIKQVQVLFPVFSIPASQISRGQGTGAAAAVWLEYWYLTWRSGSVLCACRVSCASGAASALEHLVQRLKWVSSMASAPGVALAVAAAGAAQPSLAFVALLQKQITSLTPDMNWQQLVTSLNPAACN